jgi:aminomethyltransferase
VWLAGTGYTGERGGEIVTDSLTAATLVEMLGEAGAVPCGLAARDTLRLEAGLLLAGQDFDPTTNPLEAGLDWAVNVDHEFVGRNTWLALKDSDPEKKLVAFRLAGRKIPRHGYRLRTKGSTGEVTSGNFSPTLGDGIGIGYLAPATREDPEVEIRDVWEQATAVDMPFLRK